MNKLITALLVAIATPVFAQPVTDPPVVEQPAVVAPATTAQPQPAPVSPPPPALSRPEMVSPFGSSPHVIAYNPPVVPDRAHRGLTLEIAVGGGTTSIDTDAGAVTFAIGAWLTRDISLAFRATDVGSFGFVGGSMQYYATRSLWLGAGAGSFSEKTMDEYGGFTRVSGGGAFGRGGFNLARGGKHALYISGEVQAGGIDGLTRVVGLLSLGYQLL